MPNNEAKHKEIAAAAIKRSRSIISSDPQLASIPTNFQLTENLSSYDVSCEQMIDSILEYYSRRKALGSRSYTINRHKERNSASRTYDQRNSYKTYGQLRNEIQSIANAWRHIPTLAVNRDEFVAILGFAGAEYFGVDCATVYAQAVSVPLQSASAGADLNDIFDRIQPVCLSTSYEDLTSAIELAANHKSLRSLIVFDIDLRVDAERAAFEAARDSLASNDIRVETYSKLVELGAGFDFKFLPDHPEGNERLALIIHSSGSTGIPKGAMISAATVKQYWVGTPEKYPSITVIFSPLNHILGRASLLQILGKGSIAYFTLASDMSTLFEDIRIARPTWLAFFPRVLDMIFQHYQNEVVKQISAGSPPAAAKAQVIDDMRYSFLGDRLTTATVGSAPTSQAVKDFMAECFQIWMWDGYGSTEAGSGSVTINGIINRKAVLEYKLRDVPELGYYLTDKPYPRGEFCFKGKNQIKGFYKDPEATRHLLTDDGYIITGDIVEEREQDRIVIVDRRKDVVKLSQGEYVAVGPLGAVFEGGSPFIKQIYIYGNSHQAYLVAVVVPDIKALMLAAGGPVDETEVKTAIRQAILDVAKAEKLKSFEAPRDFIIENEPFSQSNGLLSSVRKKLRPALKLKYGESLEALYARHAQSVDADVSALKAGLSEISSVETLKRLLAIHLRYDDDVVVAQDKNFGELGGDSLGAVNFSLLVEDVFDVIFPADKILDPTGNILSWAKDIQTLRSTESVWPSFASIHGAGSQLVKAMDLKLSAFLDRDLINNARNLTEAPQMPRSVLLTGATGFLGRYVCLKWLSVLPETGRLICMVRAQNDEDAKQRLDTVFEEAGDQIQQLYTQLSHDRLDVIAADIAMPFLGLGKDRFETLAQEVDRICHVGALVNHRLAYEHLFSPNVAGTAEIIKLALTNTRKPIDFVSTISVLPLLDRKTSDKEAAAPADEVPLSDAYASGYATSKWGAEILLDQASELAAIPVNILRGNMMLAHREFPGAINPSDMFTRLLFSVIATGVAPQSFYQGDSINYDGLPVDLIASAVVNMRTTENVSVTVMNACNYAPGSGFSLDGIISGIRRAGYDVEEIADYQDWFERLTNRLHNLPEAEKQKSAIDLLPAFQHPQSSRVQTSFANFEKLVMGLEDGLPDMSDKYVSKLLGDLTTIGLLSAPETIG